VGARAFFTVENDGLRQPWINDGLQEPWLLFVPSSVYVNPPYGKAREPWVEKCIHVASFGVPTILLIPAATDTRIFQKAARSATAVIFVQGRVKFGTLRPNRRQHAASHPSALIGWNTNLDACSQLGLRVSA